MQAPILLRCGGGFDFLLVGSISERDQFENALGAVGGGKI